MIGRTAVVTTALVLLVALCLKWTTEACRTAAPGPRDGEERPR